MYFRTIPIFIKEKIKVGAMSVHQILNVLSDYFNKVSFQIFYQNGTSFPLKLSPHLHLKSLSTKTKTLPTITTISGKRVDK